MERRRGCPYRVKIQAISSGTEAAIMILRINDVLSSESALGGMPPGEPGGMGEMGGMEGMD